MKRALFLVLTLVLLLSVVPTAFAAEDVILSGTCGENLTWELDSSGTLTISGTGYMSDYTGASYAPWYQYRRSIQSVVIKYGVTSIGINTFENCTSLESITLPDSVTSIGERAFYNCTSLKGITIPDSVTSIGERAFYDCTALTDVYFGGTAGQWAKLSNRPSAKYMHYSCTTAEGHWETEEVAASCETDGYSRNFCPCGYECNKVITQTALGHNYVDGVCTGCQEVKLLASGTCGKNLSWKLDAKGVLTIYGTGPMSYFSYDSSVPWYNYRKSIQSVMLEDGVTSIGGRVFKYCTSLESITIPNSVTSIGSSAFEGCTSLESITIPGSVTSIDNGVFSGCTSLESITIPNSVTSISFSAFENCTSLESITIPNRVTSIGSSAFENCTSLESITIPNSVTSIDSYAFENCHALTSITIPRGVTIIYAGVFYNCTSLESITIPSSVTSIDPSAFRNCTALTDVYFGGKSGHWDTLGITPEADYIHYSCTTAEGHWETEEVAASCETDGSVYDTCACGYKRNEETIPATGHSYDPKVTAPTCTEQGYTTYTCRCGDSYVDDYVDATGHVYENGICTGCGEKEITYAPGDIDKDGDVDVDDVLALLWHVLFPEDYPLS